ncbi:MAG: hypothetical protein A4E53_01780 [Pelotomaculum sp. PtaB.Bin104]|nr:MAG: hypothetical protein A4E53_01780 [Pelotomaculum sp. PtaB.Bin104]
MIGVDLAKKLAKHLTWEPQVGDLTIVFGEAGEEIVEPIIPRHEKERKIVLSLREMGDLVWLPRLGRLLYELKTKVKRDFVLNYHKDTDKWCYQDEAHEICSDTPEDACGEALLMFYEKQ